MENLNSKSSLLNFPLHWAWVIMLVGFCFMVITINFSDVINSNFPTQEAKADNSATTPSPLQAIPRAEAAEYPGIHYQEKYIQDVLSDPMNFYQTDTRPTPAQAIVEGRGVKFLMGF